jgi:hypothetical protein
MERSLFEEIASIVAQLPSADAFRELKRHEDPQAFGNAWIIYEAANLKLRFVNDRGEIRTEIAVPGQAVWWTLDQLCEVLGERRPGVDVHSNGEILLENYSRVLASLSFASLPQTMASIHALAQKKREEMLARFRRP